MVLKPKPFSKMGFALALPLAMAFFLLLSIASAKMSSNVGVCYGQLGNDLPSPPHSVDLIKSLKATRVKIYDANPEILNAFKGTDIQVSIMVPNEIINNISLSDTLADEWVKTNVLPYLPGTRIRYLLVGNEILSWPDKVTWYNLVPAMRKMRKSLKTLGVRKVKVGTPLAVDAVQSISPPSNGTFRPDISDSVMRPMLHFLNRTKSFFFLDAYTYFPWASDPKNIPLAHALLEPTDVTFTDPVTKLTYTNIFDQIVDSFVFAMRKLGYPDIRVFIAETGWPNGGDYDQIGASIYNAATYNRNIVKKLTAKPPIGTPARPGWAMPAILFALFNENQKPGPGTERHFGLLYPNGTDVYGIDLSGKTPEVEYKPLPKPTNNEPYKGKIWCVADKAANASALASALSYACSQGNNTCASIQPGKACSKPASLVWKASVAFSSYWAQFKKVGGTCYFNGLATQTVEDPSHGSCQVPSVTL